MFSIAQFNSDMLNVERKLKTMEYQDSIQMAMEIRKIFAQAVRQCSAGSEMYISVVDLNAYFE